MIGVISSTIYPPEQPGHDGMRTWMSPEMRLQQTQQTVTSLLNAGISEIYLADNSGDQWIQSTANLLKPAMVHVFKHYQYKNKGISELYLLLSILEYISSSIPILKISGRYTLEKSISHTIIDADIGGKFYRHGCHDYSLSTRCYVVRNKDVYKTFIERTLREVYRYQSRIVGIRSFVRILKNSLFPGNDSYPYEDPRTSIEGAAARVLSIYQYRVNQIEMLGVNGQLGGFDGSTNFIRE